MPCSGDHHFEAPLEFFFHGVATIGGTGEVKELRCEVGDMKEIVADFALENGVLKKSIIGDGGDPEFDTPHLNSLRSFGLCPGNAT